MPPLDGGRVLNGLVSEAVASRLDRIEPYGLVILVVLMATGLLGQILSWPLALAEFAVLSLIGLPMALRGQTPTPELPVVPPGHADSTRPVLRPDTTDPERQRSGSAMHTGTRMPYLELNGFPFF